MIEPNISFHRLIQGDCLKVLPTLEDGSIDFILTDPPFNVNLSYKNYNDNQGDEYYSGWLKSCFIEFKHLLKFHHYGVVFTGDKKCYWVLKALKESGLRFHHFIKWYKPNCQRALSGTVFFCRVELGCLFSIGTPDTSLINRKKMFQDIIICKNTLPNDKDAVNHNARRPVPLYEQLIEGFTKKNDTVLDCFLGSGTTMISSANLGRNCIGIEINPDYCEITKKRCFGKTFPDLEVEYKFEVFTEELMV